MRYPKPDLKELLKDIRKVHFNASKLQLSARKVESWKSNDLISVDPNDKRRIKFTIVDAVWLTIIADLRHYGVSYDNIKVIKDELFRSRMGYKDEIEANLKDPKSRESKLQKKESLTIEELGELIENHYEANYIEAAICDALILKEQCSFVINKRFAVDYINPVVLNFDSDVSRFGGSTFLQISLTNVLSRVLSGDKHNCTVLNDFVMNEHEMLLIDQIRDNKICSLVIEPWDNRPFSLVIKNEKFDKEELEQQVTDIILLNKYKSISVELMDGSGKNFIKTQRVNL